MRPRQPNPLGRVSFLAALVLGAVCGTGSAATPAPSLMERVKAESHRVMVQFQNASWRLKKNIQGMDLGTEDEQAPPTALRKCCSANIKKIDKAIGTLETLFVELESCYDGAGDSDGVIALEFIKADLAEFAWAFNELAKIRSQETAANSLSGVTRAFIKYRDGVEDLPPCPAEAKAQGEGDEQAE